MKEQNNAGALLGGGAPYAQVGAELASTYNNYSAKQQARKPPGQCLSGVWNRQAIKAQLQTYLDLGLTPIPLRGKIPRTKWRHGWDPRSLEDLEPYKNCLNWGIKTGANLCVIDFDSPEIFAKFAAENIEHLPDGLPLVKTGRGFHLWFRSSEPLRDAHFDGIDIKADGGQIVAPPSIHPKTNRPYRFLWQLGDSIPKLNVNSAFQ